MRLYLQYRVKLFSTAIEQSLFVSMYMRFSWASISSHAASVQPAVMHTWWNEKCWIFVKYSEFYPEMKPYEECVPVPGVQLYNAELYYYGGYLDYKQEHSYVHLLRNSIASPVVIGEQTSFIKFIALLSIVQLMWVCINKWGFSDLLLNSEERCIT